jgi:cytochrome P450
MCFASDHSVFNVSDPRDHKRKRSVLSPLFSPRAVLDLEVVIQDKIERMMRRIHQHYQDGKDMNFHFIFRAVTIDIVTDFCYAEPYKYVCTSPSIAPFIGVRRDTAHTS